MARAKAEAAAEAKRVQDKENALRSRLAAFAASDAGCASLALPASLSSFERMLVHRLADELGLEHSSSGEGKARFITVHKKGGALRGPGKDEAAAAIATNAAPVDVSSAEEAPPSPATETVARAHPSSESVARAHPPTAQPASAPVPAPAPAPASGTAPAPAPAPQDQQHLAGEPAPATPGCNLPGSPGRRPHQVSPRTAPPHQPSRSSRLPYSSAPPQKTATTKRIPISRPACRRRGRRHS